MSHVPGLGRLADAEVIVLQREAQLLKDAFAAFQETSRPAVESVAAKLAARSNLTRAELAIHLGVSTKKIQRMEAAGKITRLQDLAPLVRFAARDVLRLASAR